MLPPCSCSNGGEEIEKEACFVLGLLAIKPEHQHAIADQGALQVPMGSGFNLKLYFKGSSATCFRFPEQTVP